MKAASSLASQHRSLFLSTESNSHRNTYTQNCLPQTVNTVICFIIPKQRNASPLYMYASITFHLAAHVQWNRYIHLVPTVGGLAQVRFWPVQSACKLASCDINRSKKVVAVPSTPGCTLKLFCHCLLFLWLGVHDITVHTWRPAGTKVLDKLRRYFIGGSPEIEDIHYIASPPDFKVSLRYCLIMREASYTYFLLAANLRVLSSSQSTHLSKHGFRTVSSGNVTFQLNVLHQSR